MKRITNTTILKQSDKTYQPRFVMPDDIIIYWVDLSNHIEDVHSMVGKNVWSVRYAKPIIFGEHENSYLNECYKIVAQSQPKLKGIPVISLDSYVERLCSNILQTELCDSNDESGEYWRGDSVIRLLVKALNKNNPQKDIEKAIKLARKSLVATSNDIVSCHLDDLLSFTEIFEKINSLSVIEVNDNWEIISYE